jgi:hypothetical protein
MQQAALGLCAPQAIGRHLDGAHTVVFDAKFGHDRDS